MSQAATKDSIWVKVALAEDVPANGGATILYKGKQIALFNFSRKGEWFATQNLCPHKKEMILSRGMLGSKGDEPKVACPFHKKNFSLKTGACLDGEDYEIKTYGLKEEGGYLYLDDSTVD